MPTRLWRLCLGKMCCVVSLERKPRLWVFDQIVPLFNKQRFSWPEEKLSPSSALQTTVLLAHCSGGPCCPVGLSVKILELTKTPISMTTDGLILPLPERGFLVLITESKVFISKTQRSIYHIKNFGSFFYFKEKSLN